MSNLSKRYIDNIKTMIYASDALNGSEKIARRGVGIAPQEDVNPMVEKLKSLHILNSDNNNDVGFYGLLPLVEKEKFIDVMLMDEAREISDKIKGAPQLVDYIKHKNKAIEEVVEEYDLIKISVGVIGKKNNVANRGVLKRVKKVKASILFKSLNEKFNKREEKIVTKGLISISSNYPTVNTTRVKNIWSQSANRGDIVVALPNMFIPYNYLNFGKGVRYAVGHAGVINKKITSNTGEDEASTIECWAGSGVSKKSISYWDTPHFLMGICNTHWEWRWRGFMSRFHKISKEVSHPYKLANQVEKYKGNGYVKWYEFINAKQAAPLRFTCTTLIWFGAEKAYGINVSSWWNSLVTPHELVFSDKTYLKRVVW